MKTINELTEDCLIWLFGQFSLQELIELRKVCQLWAVIIAQICQRKKSLKIFGSPTYIANYSAKLVAHRLQLDKKLLLKAIGEDDELVGCLWANVSDLFTNVEHLVHCDSTWQFGEILKSMPNITNIFLIDFFEDFYDFKYENQKERFSKVLVSLDQLGSLKHLHLDGKFPPKDYQLPEIEIFFKLESLSLAINQEGIVQILNRVGEPLRMLELHESIQFEKFEQCMSRSKISTNITHLSVGTGSDFPNKVENKKLFHFICDNFRTLETFEFGSILSFKQDETIFSLAKLKNLSDLRVEQMWDVENSLLTDKLEQIKKLQLSFKHFHFETFPQLSVRSIFPNLESISIMDHEEEFFISAKSYLVDELKLTCRIQCELINTDKLIYMGRHRKQHEIDEEIRLDGLAKSRYEKYLENLEDEYYDFDDRYSESSQESYMDPYNNYD